MYRAKAANGAAENGKQASARMLAIEKGGLKDG